MRQSFWVFINVTDLLARWHWRRLQQLQSHDHGREMSLFCFRSLQFRISLGRRMDCFGIFRTTSWLDMVQKRREDCLKTKLKLVQLACWSSCFAQSHVTRSSQGGGRRDVTWMTNKNKNFCLTLCQRQWERMRERDENKSSEIEGENASLEASWEESACWWRWLARSQASLKISRSREARKSRENEKKSER